MKVSIIIPVFNRLEYTEKCLDSIFKFGSKYSFEIIIINNASSDGTRKFLDALGEKIIAIHNDDNLGFAKACNQGAEKAGGKYLLFLNNDTIVTENWLDVLIEELDANPETAIAGNKLLFPDETIQHAGVVFGEDRSPYHIYYREKKEQLYVNKKRRFQAVTGACLIIRKVVFDEVGGFDEAYKNGFEDIDLCLKVGKMGMYVMYCPKSVVYHYESISDGRIAKNTENQKLFIERWHDKIAVDFKDIMISDGTLSKTEMVEIQSRELESMKALLNQKNQELFEIKERLREKEDVLKSIEASFFWKMFVMSRKILHLIKFFFIVIKRDGLLIAFNRMLKKIKK